MRRFRLPFAPSVTSVASIGCQILKITVAKCLRSTYNEAVQRSPGTYPTVEVNPDKPKLGDYLRLCTDLLVPILQLR